MLSQPLRANSRSSQVLITSSVIRSSPYIRSARLQACERPRLPPGRLIGCIGIIRRYSP